MRRSLVSHRRGQRPRGGTFIERYSPRELTGRFGHPPVEVFFDRCRENGIKHLLTAPAPPTTGEIERFHRSPAAVCLTGGVFAWRLP